MAHKYPNVLIHCVFSTRNREDLIPDELRLRLWKYFAGIGKNHNIPVLCAGGVANHAHLLIALPSDISLAKAMQVLKANSSRWLGDHGIKFAWQEGYGAFSVISSNAAAVKQLLNNGHPALPCRAFLCRRFAAGARRPAEFTGCEVHLLKALNKEAVGLRPLASSFSSFRVKPCGPFCRNRGCASFSLPM
jgi:putative transposase